MKKRLITFVLALSMVLSAMPFATAAEPAAASDPFAEKLTNLYASENLEMEYRPSVRWWLAEGLNTDETLKKNIQEIYDSGFGAAEFLAMPEDGADSKLYGWGSEEWNTDSQLIIKEAAKLGLGFSLTSGTHWSNANLPDTYTWEGEAFNPDNKAASKELDYATINLSAGEQFNGKLPEPAHTKSGGCGGATTLNYSKNELVSVAAGKVVTARQGSGGDTYAEGNGVGVLDLSTMMDLTDKVVTTDDGTISLNWTAPDDGDYAIFAYWLHGTGQTADPSVSTNYTVNYMDSYGIQAVIDYWNEYVLNDELVEILKASGKGEIYMDSLEVSTYGAGGLFWGLNFKDEFKTRMGYDITPYLPFISAANGSSTGGSAKIYDYVGSNDSDNAIAAKVRDDYYRVMSDMYEENVLEPLKAWLHTMNMTLRAEPSYGFNFEISTPAKYIDKIETESFAQNADIDLYRGILGGANMYNRPFSSETGAVGGNNYTYNMDEWTQLCYLQFVNGVNRTVFHGYSAIEGSEGSTQWPGHEGMYSIFSERFNSRQPASAQYPQWTEMLTRNQKALRQGVASRDIAILRSDYHFINYGFQNGWDNFTKNYQMHDTPYYWSDLELQHNGYTYDYFSPLLLTDEDNVSWTSDVLQPDGPAYQAIMLYQEELEYEAAEKLLEIAKDGLPVVFVNHNTEYVDNAGTFAEHQVAASKSRHTDHTDAELQAVVAQIKALPNVATVDSPADAMEQLQKMGVYARVSFTEPTNEVLTVSRNDAANDIYYTFAYAFKFAQDDAADVNTVTLSVEGEGKPYRIDDWTGEVTALGNYEFRDGRTLVTLTLNKGEAALLAFDMSGNTEGVHAVKSDAADVILENGDVKLKLTENGQYHTTLSDGTEVTTNVTLPDAIQLPTWDITIEDWNEGEKMTNTEEKFGHTTTEVYYTTKKTEISFPASELNAWKDLPATAEQLATLNTEAMSDVSGVGTYTTTFTLPDGWTAETPAMLRIGSTNGSIVQVYVNDQAAGGVDTRDSVLDITGLLTEGENTVKVVLPTTLTNRLRVLGRGGVSANKPIQSYGMTGVVEVVPYALVSASDGVVLSLTGDAEVTMDVDTLTYTLTAAHTDKLATATLTFAVDGLIAPVVNGENGWYVIAQNYADGILHVVMGNNQGVTGDEAAMLTISGGHAAQEGTVSVALKAAVLSGYTESGETFLSTVLSATTVETAVKYSIYDVNRDGVVNQLDITRAQRYYGTDDEICDVNEDGEVNIADLILILNHYTKK